MASMLSSDTWRFVVLGGLITSHLTWLHLNTEQVPEPYLDEVFHIPQAQAYWDGLWTQWDPKITTPPGLYVFSVVFNILRGKDRDEPLLARDWRLVNLLLSYILLVPMSIWRRYQGKDDENNTATYVLQREFSIIMFPLLFFFSGLYYTDLFAAFTVMVTYMFWQAGLAASTRRSKLLFQLLHFVFGLLSLSSRQTNVFWVAVFLGGLQVVETCKRQAIRIQSATIYDPPIEKASIEDYISLSMNVLMSSLKSIPALLVDLWPQIGLLFSFTAFVVWNGGVVLGDKTNHVATIHIPQMLYIWPCIVFFSWPILLPQLLSLSRFRKQLPRLPVAVLTILAMATAVHYNTIVHPFTLADNRHYVFYVFRILTRRWWIKYAAVPVYYICACLVVGGLGRSSDVSSHRKITGKDGTTASFVLIWFISTALSLVTAPLVEPRYFIISWLIWRLHVPDVSMQTDVVEGSRRDISKSKAGKKLATSSKPTTVSSGPVQSALQKLVDYALWVELAWYLVVNYATCWMFLNRGFAWPQEPGKVQRFMW